MRMYSRVLRPVFARTLVASVWRVTDIIAASWGVVISASEMCSRMTPCSFSMNSRSMVLMEAKL